MQGAVLLLLLFIVGLFLMWKIPLLKGFDLNHKPARTELPTVSIIIPARNEVRRIKFLLDSLHRQEYPVLEIILADDASSDETATIAREKGAQVISIQDVPDGWLGKSWACWQGALHSRGELLLFLDADTWLDQNGLEKIVAEYLKVGGLLTVQPYHVTCTAYEQFSAMINIVMMAGINAFTPLGKRLKPSGGFGPCMICRREDYFRVGGHAAVKNELLDDMAFAKTFAQAGYPLSCYGGRGTIYFRMYPDGLGKLIEGWSKGLALGAGFINFIFLILVSAWICGCFGVFADLLRSLRSNDQRTTWLWLSLYSLYAVQIHWMLRRIGNFRWWTWVFFPLPLIFFAALMFYSLIITYFIRQVKWRDRVIPTGTRNRP
jgi:4,4'-diaponeurosporenoate glycosyltransferase